MGNFFRSFYPYGAGYNNSQHHNHHHHGGGDYIYILIHSEPKDFTMKNLK